MKRTKKVRKGALVDNKGVSSGATNARLHYDMGTWNFTSVSSGSTTDSYSYLASTEGTPLAFCFKLKNCSGYNRYTSMFEKYRITGAKVTLVPRNNIGSSGAVADNRTDIPWLMYRTVGIDDANPAEFQTIAKAMTQDNVNIAQCTRLMTIKVTKPIVNGVVSTAGDNTIVNTTAYVAQTVSPWLDTEGGADVGHFGLKTLLQATDGVSTVNPQSVRIFVTLFCEFKTIKGLQSIS